MTRNDYFLIAQIIKDNTKKGKVRKKLVDAFIPVLKADNPNFNAFRFMLATDTE